MLNIEREKSLFQKKMDLQHELYTANIAVIKATSALRDAEDQVRHIERCIEIITKAHDKCFTDALSADKSSFA
ncbi:hypothetical protein FACS189427_10770 [Planctomycetales bacterium]|nr:hypothetical protein FACS189427_10770 [Planctomycetales bacterium]